MAILPCEKVVKETLPALRVSTSLELYRTYSLNQSEIALKLGITQASVSKYLSGNIALKLKKLSNEPKMKELGILLAKQLSDNSSSNSQIANYLCSACISYREQDCSLKEPVLI